MCGFAGIVGYGDESDISRMVRAVAHRGPDDEAFYQDSEQAVRLGFRRLVVIDPEGGLQPMRTSDDALAVVFNGEIYNHRDLRRELESLGHVFASDHSDTEVLLHGYRQWGAGLPERLNGMFAFAIHDRNAARIFLARDRFGEKPLYLAERRGIFAFASELGALCQHPNIAAEWDRTALQKYFAYGFFPAPLTPFRGIAKLPAGHCLIRDIGEARSTLHEYWRFSITPEETGRSEDSLAEELRAVLKRSVADRLEADVPLGFLLSGGIDSSAVIRCAADARGHDELRAFSIGFSEPSFDEARHARTAANFVGARHHSRTCSLADMKAAIKSLLECIDEPLGDSSILPTYQVCRHARDHVTVALTGDGGDELFAGYDPFRALALASLYHRAMPQGLHAWITALIGQLPISDRNLSLDFRLRRAMRGLRHGPPLWNPVWIAPLAADEISQLFGAPVSPEDLYSEAVAAWNACPSPNPIDRTSEFFTRFYLQDDILLKSDRASMLVSLELRAPFLDNDLVAFATRLPARYKYRRGTTKYLLRKALAPLLPSEIIARPKKGFGIPLSAWLRDMPMPDAGSGLPLDEDWLSARWQEHRSGRRDWRHALWCWMTLRHTATRRP